jgi:hypothetical protein
MYLVTTDQNGCITKMLENMGFTNVLSTYNLEMFLLPEEMRNEPVGFKLNKKSLKCLDMTFQRS